MRTLSRKKLDETQTQQKITGFNLKKIRISRQLTQEGMAIRLGTNKGYVSAMESGKRGIGKKMMIKIIKEFNVSYSNILEPPPELMDEYGMVMEPEAIYTKEKTEIERVIKDIKEIFEKDNEVVKILLKTYVKDLLKIMRKTQ